MADPYWDYNDQASEFVRCHACGNITTCRFLRPPPGATVTTSNVVSRQFWCRPCYESMKGATHVQRDGSR